MRVSWSASKECVVANPWALHGGLYLGVATDRLEGPPPPYNPKLVIPYTGDRHCIIIGANGSGKTRRLYAVNIERLKSWSQVIVDPKGILATLLVDHVPNPKVYDPFGVTSLRESVYQTYNAVAALDPDSDEFVDDAMGQAESIISSSTHKESHWGESGQEIMAGLLMYSRLTKKGGGSLPHIRQILALPPERLKEEVEFILEAADSYDYEELFNKVSKLKDVDPDNKEIFGILSTCLTQTRWVDSRRIRAMIEGPPAMNGVSPKQFDFATLKKEPTTVFLILPPDRLRTHAAWLKLMLTSIIQPLMKSTAKGVPVAFWLDEYYPIAKNGFPLIDDNIAMFREFGIKIILALQSLSQAIMLWGRDGWQGYINNMGVAQFFGTNDVVTSKFVSDMSGENFVPVGNTSGGVSYGPTGVPTIQRGESSSLQRMPVIWPQEVRNMDAGYSVIYSNITKGPYRSYLPYPKDIPHMKAIFENDPSA